MKTFLALIGMLTLLAAAFFGGVMASEKGLISITIERPKKEVLVEGTRAKPIPPGNSVKYGNREVKVLKVEKVGEIHAKENGEGVYKYMPNGEGYYLIITVQIKNTGPSEKVSYYSTREFKVVGSKGKIYPYGGDPLMSDRLLKFIGGNELFEGELLGGDIKTGRILRPVDADDTDLLLTWEPEKGVFLYLALP